MIRVLALLLLAAALTPAEARPRLKRVRGAARRAVDPARWFATRQGLIRVYQQRAPKARGRPVEDPPQGAGTSCEVVESRAAEAEVPPRTRELCTWIVGKRPKLSTQLSYELRQNGIYVVRMETEGKASGAERLVLPGPLRVGQRWKERRGGTVLDRRVKSAGKSCKAAGRAFGDCLVVAVSQRKGGKRMRFTETYAAGVGLVEDNDWQLVDVKGL